MTKTPRKSLSKSIRFKVLVRDNFICQYCGAQSSAEVELEVDHIHPVAKGGTNSIDNLITACWDCNHGKGARLLSSIPQTVADKAAKLQAKLDKMAEKQRELLAFQAMQDAKIAALAPSIDLIDAELQKTFPDCSMPDDCRDSVVRFLDDMCVAEVVHAMATACARMNHVDRAFRYFCGICWRTIKDDYSFKE